MLASVADGPSTLENGATGTSLWLLEPPCLAGPFPRVVCWAVGSTRLLSDLALLSLPLLSMAAGFAGSCWIYLLHAVLQILAGSVGLPWSLGIRSCTWAGSAAPELL